MDNFTYYTPTRVFFGRGEECKVGEHIKAAGGTKVLIHYGGHSAEKTGLLDKVRKSLTDAGLLFVELGGVHANPALSMVRKGAAFGIEQQVDFVLAVGGGSVMDSSKAIAHAIANPETDEWQFQTRKVPLTRSVGKGCILTLAAAGSEMSSSCVITNEETGEKRGFNSDFNRMSFAIEDPELTFSVDRFQTGCGAVDISMHTMERYFGKGSDTDLTDAIAEAVMRENNKAGRICVTDPQNYEARATMMWASSLAHNDLTGMGRAFFMQVHQLEHEISGMYPRVAHGAGLSALWASWARYVMPFNTMRFAKFAHNVWNIEMNFDHPEETARMGIQAQEDYYRQIGMPVSLRALDIAEEDLPILAHNCTFKGSRTLSGVKELTEEDILKIYQAALAVQ